MPDTIQSIIIAALASGLSCTITYFSTRAKVRLDLSAEYDKKLQEDRLKAYKKLWGLLEPIAGYGRDEPFTYAVLHAVSSKTRSWYFQGGGIYLTPASAQLYRNWKGLMQPVLDDDALKKNPNSLISPPSRDAIIEASNLMRVSLSDDIGTKRLSRV